MWDVLLQWFRKYQASLGYLLIASIGTGLTAAAACFFFPSVLLSFSALTFFGIAPFGFLTTLPFPLALGAFAGMMSGVAFGIFAFGILSVNQIISVSTHLNRPIVEENPPKKEYKAGKTAYDYIQAHLKDVNSHTEEFDDEYNEANSSDSSDEDSLTDSSIQPVVFASEESQREQTTYNAFCR